MMGPKKEPQAALFYEFDLDQHVPADHVLRQIDRFVDLSNIRAVLKPYYSSVGRPSIDPELMIRMLLVGYCMGIRSERRLCEEVHLNLAYRWFCRLDLTDAIPDHSTFSKNRHGRFRESDLFRHVFNTVLARCIADGLVGGDDFGVDASLIKADASRYTKVEMVDWSVPDQVSRARRNISILWTAQPLVAQHPYNPRRSLRLTRQHATRVRTATGRSSPIPPTIWWIWTMPSSSMWMRPHLSVRPKSRSPRT